MGRSLQILVDMPIKRQCGDCSLCCTVMAVNEDIAKPANVKCTKLTAMGKCSIYPTKPTSCTTFKCLWLRGFLPDELKPSRSRVVADIGSSGNIVVFHVSPFDRGAWNKPAVQRWIASVADKIMVVIVCGNERLVLGLHSDKNVRFEEVESIGVEEQYNIIVDLEDGENV